MNKSEEKKFVPDKIGPYILQTPIGHGAFSTVYGSRHELSNAKVAVKVISKSDFPADKFERELSIMKKLDHPFIASFYDFLQDEVNYYLVMEYCENGSLFAKVNQTGRLPEWMIRHVLCELICTLEYLHNEVRVAHRDIKLENIMFDRNENIRLIDFGLGNVFGGAGACLQTACGSPAYAPPEMLTGKPYGTSADVWSTGIALYAMAYGKLPFRDANIQRLISKIVLDTPDFEETISPELSDLLQRILVKDVDMRITIPQIKMHPFYTAYPRAPFMNMAFGLDRGWRCHAADFQLSRPVIEEMQKLENVDIAKISEELELGVFNAQTAIYRIIKRRNVTDELCDMLKEANANAERRSSVGLPRPTLKSSAEMKNVLEQMKRNRNDSKYPPVALPVPQMPGFRLTQNRGASLVKSLNPRQSRAVHHAAMSIVQQHTSFKRRGRAFSLSGQENAPNIPTTTTPPPAHIVPV